MKLKVNSSIPLYEQLINKIKLDIANDIYTPGSQMPSETDLINQYNVSRITVRRAINELCNENILTKKQGKGTFVLPNDKTHSLTINGGFHEEMTKLGKKVTSKVIENKIIKVNETYANALKIGLNDDVISLKRLMYVNNTPKMVDTILIPYSRFPNIRSKFTGDFSFFDILRKEYDVIIDYFYKVVKVRKASKEIAPLLECNEDDPIFDLYKVSYNQNHIPLHISISYITGNDAYYVIYSEEKNLSHFDGFNWREK